MCTQAQQQWAEFEQRGHVHQKVLEYRIPALEADRLMEKAEQCIADIKVSLVEGEKDERLWQQLQVRFDFGDFESLKQ